MGLTTLERYLYRPSKSQGDPVSAAPPKVSHLDLIVRVLSAVRRSFLRGSAFSDLSERVDVIRRVLVVESSTVGVEDSATQLEALLEEFQTRSDAMAQQQAAEFGRVIAILNETFTHLHNGRESATALMSHLEGGLGKAARIEDLPTLRSHLAKMLELVRIEGKRERLESDLGLSKLGTQIQETYAACSRLGARFPQRIEAIEELRSMLLTPETKPHVGLFRAESLDSVTSRYGKEVSAILLDELGRKHLAPLVPNGKLYQWSRSSVLVLWNHLSDESSAAGLFSTAKFSEHKAFVNGRIASFKLTVKSVVVKAAGSPEDIIELLDRFSGGK